MSKVSYTKKQRAEALDLLDREGIRAAVAASGAHKTTIYRWLAESVAQLPEEKRREQAQAQKSYEDTLRSQTTRRMLEVRLDLLDEVANAGNALEAQRWATACGILDDKLAGRSAAVEHVPVGHIQFGPEQEQQIDRELRDLVQEFERTIEWGVKQGRRFQPGESVGDWAARQRDEDDTE